MKLNIVPARTGIEWVKLGIKTFSRQPLALAGLFFMYMMAASLLSLLPVLGPFLALAIVPAATLGLMVATEHVIKGKFPTPLVLLSAFRAGRTRLRAMLVLGVIYAACWIAILLVLPLLVDMPAQPAPEAGQPTLPTTQMLSAMMLTLVLYAPISLMFWHAPALVHWHGVSPVKSLFFSTVACLRNVRALVMFGVAWFAVLSLGVVLISLVAELTGRPQLVVAMMAPLVLVSAAMFTTSIYFTFRDSFVATSDAEEQQPPGEPT